jgi:hypothetical protein
MRRLYGFGSTAFGVRVYGVWRSVRVPWLRSRLIGMVAILGLDCSVALTSH